MMAFSYPVLAAAFYAGLNGLILFGLTFAVVRVRTRRGVLIGDGGDTDLVWAMRAQANFAELVPLTLAMLMLTAALGAPGWAVHILGLVLTAARLMHAAHFLGARRPMVTRVAGTIGTVSVLLLCSAGVVLHAAAQML